MNSKSLIPELDSKDPRVHVGRFTYGNPELRVWREEDFISIGSFCSIADDVLILGGGEHRADWITTYPLRIAFGDERAGRDGHPATKGGTIIGSDVWIGHGATILSGVVVGHGAVIGAKSVVAKSVPPYAVVVGNPCREVRKRFRQDQIEKLLSIAWWDWPIERVRGYIDLLSSPDIDGFIRSQKACEDGA